MSAVPSARGRAARTKKNPDGPREACKERERKSRRGFLQGVRGTEPPAAQQLGRCSPAEPGKQLANSQCGSHIVLVFPLKVD